jgi:hypothetical protein
MALRGEGINKITEERPWKRGIESWRNLLSTGFVLGSK